MQAVGRFYRPARTVASAVFENVLHIKTQSVFFAGNPMSRRLGIANKNGSLFKQILIPA
jgi:hypothetical protein